MWSISNEVKSSARGRKYTVLGENPLSFVFLVFTQVKINLSVGLVFIPLERARQTESTHAFKEGKTQVYCVFSRNMCSPSHIAYVCLSSCLVCISLRTYLAMGDAGQINFAVLNAFNFLETRSRH